MDQPTAEEALAPLNQLVGEWALEAGPPGGEPWPGGGHSSITWHESGAHLIERSTVELPEAPDGWKVIGCDAGNGTYHQLYSDERGVCRVYSMSIDADGWSLWREGRPFAQRFVSTFEDGGDTIAGRWEKREDGGDWEVDFALTYRRVG